MRLVATFAAAAVLAACSAAAAERPSVRLEGARSATAGTPWSARLVVTPATAGRPAVVARAGAARRTGTVTRTGPGRYGLRLLFPTAGRWTLSARLGGRTTGLGAVSVRAPAPVAEVDEPFAVALDAAGQVLVADRAGNRVVRIDPTTAVTTLVAEVPEPVDVAAAPDGSVLVVAGERVVRVAGGAVTTVAGTGQRGFGGDGGPAASAPLNAAGGVAVDGAGNVYVAEYENRIRRIDAESGVITTIAGNGEAGFGGDGGPAARALLHHPHGIAVAADGAVVVADTENDRFRRIDPRSGTITTIAELDLALHAAAGPDGSLYLVARDRIHRLDTDGRLRAVAGTGIPGSTGDGGPATRATFAIPNHVAVAPDGTFYVSEFEGRRVRRVDGRTGVISTLAR